MQTQSFSKAGFTLIEIMIVVAIIGLLAAIAIPNFIRSRTASQQKTCISNLRQIDGAVQQWALESGAAGTAEVEVNNIKTYLGRSTNGIDSIACPSAGSVGTFEGSYSITRVDEAPTCRIGAEFTMAHSVQ